LAKAKTAAYNKAAYENRKLAKPVAEVEVVIVLLLKNIY
jgi:hypothetical protein